MIIAAWIATVWLLSLALFVLLMGRRPKVEHPQPPPAAEATSLEGFAA